MQLFLFGGVSLLQNLRAFFRTYRKQLQTAGVFLLLGLAYFLLTQLTPLRIPCIFQKITGFACPGCGMTHLCMQLLRLDFAGAAGENLAAAFGRPAWDISFHVNMDAASLIGMDTFAGGQVVFRPGPVYRCAQCGGFGVLDEINMAKNEALAVLHAVLDFRRAIDVPGYDRIPLAEETRFIATMNYGYAGTRELNEALTSRFAVVQMPTITQDNLEKLLRAQFPDLSAKYVHQFALLFLDLQKKCDSAEISTKALDLRGMLDALRLIRRGIPAGAALDMGITNKAFDSYEQGLIRDVIAARIPAKLDAGKLFA